MPQVRLLIFFACPAIVLLGATSKLLNIQGPGCQLRSNVQYKIRLFCFSFPNPKFIYQILTSPLLNPSVYTDRPQESAWTPPVGICAIFTVLEQVTRVQHFLKQITLPTIQPCPHEIYTK
jgi:hypothetical protein